LRLGEVQRLIILFLAYRESRCAQLEHILSVVEKYSPSRSPRVQVLKALSKLARKGWITREWITDTRGRRRRLYCLKKVQI